MGTSLVGLVHGGELSELSVAELIRIHLDELLQAGRHDFFFHAGPGAL